jgi:hypothetical protein
VCACVREREREREREAMEKDKQAGERRLMSLLFVFSNARAFDWP